MRFIWQKEQNYKLDAFSVKEENMLFFIGPCCLDFGGLK